VVGAAGISSDSSDHVVEFEEFFAELLPALVGEKKPVIAFIPFSSIPLSFDPFIELAIALGAALFLRMLVELFLGIFIALFLRMFIELFLGIFIAFALLDMFI
jgi:hypothetical protein